MDNAVAKHYKDIIRNLTPEVRKKIKVDPVAGAEKWGKLQIAMAKAVDELVSLDQQMEQELAKLGAAFKSIDAVLAADAKNDQLSLSVLRRLCSAMHDKYRAGANAKLAKMNSLVMVKF